MIPSVLFVMLLVPATSYQCSPCSDSVAISKSDCASHTGCSWDSDAYKACGHVGCQNIGTATPTPSPTPTATPAPAPTHKTDPTYDHQTKSYKEEFAPFVLKKSTTSLRSNTFDDSVVSLSATPFFSPDHSTDTVTAFIAAASSTLDIGTPGFSSWSGCTAFSGCTGCAAADMSAELFPVFQALLNAVHRGVKVRVLTNDYGSTDCDGKIGPLAFLQLNGIDVRFYASTTFYHAKYMSHDSKAVAISSINFSKTSYTKNREAGVVLEGSPEAVAFFSSVYEADWGLGSSLQVNQTYSAADMSVITATAKRTVSLPVIASEMAPTPTPVAASDVTLVRAYASPDNARSTLLAQLGRVSTSLEVMIYQVTDSALCSELVALGGKSGVALKLLVSRYIYGTEDHYLATKCYEQLHAAGVTVRMTQLVSFYQYCHQKIWIVNGETIGLSTGNWSPSDFPAGGDIFVPYKNGTGWRDSNRDYTVEITSPTLATTFQKVIDTDFAAGSDYSPKQNEPLLSSHFR